MIPLAPKKAAITATSVTFTRDGAGDTITRADGGDWTTNSSFVMGGSISIAGGGDNNGASYTIASVSGTQIRITQANVVTAGTFSNVTVNQTARPAVTTVATVDFTSNAAGDQLTITGGTWGAPLTAGVSILITNAGANNGSYTVTSVTPTTLTVAHDPTRSFVATRVTTSLQFFQETVGADTFNRIRRADGSPWSSTSFEIGGTIVITGAGANNGTFTVADIQGDVLTVMQAVTAATVTKTVTRPITLTQTQLHEPGNDVHSLIKLGLQPLKYTNLGGGTLVDGRTYYVVGATSTTFQIALTPGGTALTFDKTGLTSTAGHSFTATVDLTAVSVPAGTDNTHELRIDIPTLDANGNPTTVPGTNHHLQAPGGASLSTIAGAPGDALSRANSTGSGGGFVGVGVNSATVTSNPNVKAYLDTGSAGIATAGADITITATLALNLAASARNDTGGFVGVGVSNATITVNSTNPTQAYIGSGSRVAVAGDLTIAANSVTTATASTGPRPAGSSASPARTRPSPPTTARRRASTAAPTCSSRARPSSPPTRARRRPPTRPPTAPGSAAPASRTRRSTSAPD